MNPRETAVVLIGYQNDYFAPDGVLHGVIEESARVTNTLQNTLGLLAGLRGTGVLVVATPIHFTPDYSEIVEPVGILAAIRDVGAFRAGTPGAARIDALAPWADMIVEVPGKRGLDAFSNTDLARLFESRGVRDVVLAGAVTSICIDSTGRSASERGYRVTVLSDCTTGRTPFEQDFYCRNVFPLYAQVTDHASLLRALGAG